MNLISYDNLPGDINPELMQNGSICAAISRDAINFLMHHGKLFLLHAREKVFDYGDEGDSFFIVCKGSLDFYKNHHNETCYIRNVGFGEELGFVAMIALLDRTGDAVAHEETVLLKVSAQIFGELHQEYPFDFGLMTLNLARDMARVINNISNTLVDKSNADYTQANYN